MPFLGNAQIYCHLVIHFEKEAPEMTKYIVIHTPYTSDTMEVQYSKLPIDEDNEYIWDDHFKVSNSPIKRPKIIVDIYFLNEYKLAIDRATVFLPKKELIGNTLRKNDPPGIFVK